ncbi:MAG: RtcB family protein [Chthonomonadales bacterium]|nr:RtcB family protein [Chthonomonadales bacterium]
MATPHITRFGTHELATLAQIERAAAHPMAAAAALCADGHRGYAVPIGGVVAYEDSISPSGVGYDIACGNKAVLTDADADDVRARIATIMDDVWRTLSFGIGLNNDERVDHPLFDDPTWTVEPMRSLKAMARGQLGTIGAGNHYVDILLDEMDRVWVGVHFGSRGLGHRTATHFLKAGGAKDGMDVEPLVVPARSALGEDYIACMALAGRYAYAGRDWVCERVARILGARAIEEVHNHHNFAWRERHGGRELWVVRKGATPAFPGQRGFVGGSMGDISVILAGVDSRLSRSALYSTVHGAGRVMSRTEARGKIDYRTRRPKSPGRVSRDMMMRWVRERGVELRGAGTDESPHCYRRFPEVLGFHKDTVRILHTLRPIGVAMAGEDEHDPYRD